MITAVKAREMSFEANVVNMEHLDAMIKEAARRGRSSITIPYLTVTETAILQSYGYKIKRNGDLVISW